MGIYSSMYFCLLSLFFAPSICALHFCWFSLYLSSLQRFLFYFSFFCSVLFDLNQVLLKVFFVLCARKKIKNQLNPNLFFFQFGSLVVCQIRTKWKFCVINFLALVGSKWWMMLLRPIEYKWSQKNFIMNRREKMISS